MDQSQHYHHHPSHSHSHRPPLFAQATLPPPSSLHLPPLPPNFARSNTLPPIPALQQQQQQQQANGHVGPGSGSSADSRYPPPSYHPSLAPGSPSTPTASTYGHQQHHGRASSRDDGRRRSDVRTKIEGDSTSPRESSVSGRHQPAQAASQDAKDTDDGMSATSDFVKKLYKCVSSHGCHVLFS